MALGIVTREGTTKPPPALPIVEFHWEARKGSVPHPEQGKRARQARPVSNRFSAPCVFESMARAIAAAGRPMVRSRTVVRGCTVARGRLVAGLLAVGAFAIGSLGVAAGPAAASTTSRAPDCATPSNDRVAQIPWTLTRLSVHRVWPLTTGKGVMVAVIDTGVDKGVPQLAGHVLPGVDVVNGYGTADADCFGHGTFVAGLIAAQPRPDTGVAGVAPGVMIMPIRQANDSRDGTVGGLAKSIMIAVDAGASVVNISATSFAPDEGLRQAVAYATAKNVLLVASASNEAQQGNPTAYPAAYPEVIAVGAVDRNGRRSQFSEVGNYLDLVAPGQEIVSLSRGGRGHVIDNGTSYATPFVAATAALVRSYHPGLTAAQVKRRLELTADHPPRALPDPEVGWGIVNPYNAVTAVLPEEYGSRPGPRPRESVAPVTLSTPDTSARDTAMTFALMAAVGLVIAGILAYVLPRGSDRGWRGTETDESVGRPNERVGASP
jgi:type VII secretion-associated serine protease mycosin